MASPPEKTLTITCPGCAGRFRLPASLAGRRGRCARCGAVVIVAAHAEAKSVGPAAPSTSGHPVQAAGSAHATAARAAGKPAGAEEPQYIGFECRVCQTRMYATPDQVGKRFKCPDCGAMTVVPPPPKPKAKRMPAAMEGDQYEVWEADEQPLPSELLAAQPVYIAVECRKCQTLMYATVDQVGKKMKCPDCGTPHVVPPPPAPSHKEPIVLDGAYAVDPAADPGERLPVSIAPRRKLEFEERDEAEYARALEKSRRTGKPMKIDARGRPIMPRWPLVTGVWRMLATEEIIARWILLSIVFGVAAQLLAEALLTPMQGMVEAIKMLFTVAGVVVAGVWLAMAGPLVVAMICDTAAGDDRVRQPPRLIALDWFRELFSVFFSGAVAGLCGLGAWELAHMASLGPVAAAAITTAAVLTVLPITLLSTLLEGSPLEVVSSRVLRSLRRCAGPWLLFYLQSLALAVLVGAAGWFLASKVGPLGGQSTEVAWALSPIVVAALLVYARLLGRLGWILTERMPGQ